jgi:hypothetical protein
MSINRIQVTGLENILSSLKRAEKMFATGIERGLVKAGLFLQVKSQEIVPVQTGNLKGSAFTRNEGGTGFETDITVGYTSNYAVYVHEDLNAAHGVDFNIKHIDKIATAPHRKGKSRDKMWFHRGVYQQAKFLEKPARDNRSEIIKIIANEAKLGIGK